MNKRRLNLAAYLIVFLPVAALAQSTQPSGSKPLQPAAVPPPEPLTREQVTQILKSPLPDAIKELRGVVGKNSRDGWAAYGLGYAILKNGKPSDAEPMLQRAS